MSNNNSQSSQVRDLHNEAETLVMGGRVPSDVSSPDSMAEWSDSVEDLPMPVFLLAVCFMRMPEVATETSTWYSTRHLL